MPKIIMATAHGRQEVMQQAKAAGLDGFLIKPVNPSVMLNTIMEVFGKEMRPVPRTQAKTQPVSDAVHKIKGARILLAEDNEINQQVALEILSGAGLQVVLANNGREAATAVQQQNFDAVLMDIQMPVMDGYEATKRIRKWEKQLKAHGSKRAAEDRGQRTEDRGQRTEVQDQILHRAPCAVRLPIIAMTAHAMSGDREKSLAVGMDDHVTKPIDTHELFTTLAKWIQPAGQRESGQLSGTEISGAQPAAVSDDIATRVQSEWAADSLPPSMPGFDLAAGLKRLQGNRRLYRKLLLDFGDKYGETADQIHQALASGDMDRAHSLVHNIKGLAGNLSATRLQAAATEMDRLVKQMLSGKDQPADRMRKILSELENALNEALSACRRLKRPAGEAAAAAAAASMPAMSAMSPALARQTAEQLRNAVEMGNISELKAIAEGLRSESDNFSSAILELTEDFDFEGILKIAEELKKTANR